jgi:UDP-N-acetylmuramoylalanine--D-glutamate ligase
VELIRKLRGVRYVNDSKATNVHASVAGLRSLAARLVVITGGVDKNLELDPILAELEQRARHVVVIGQIANRFVAEATGRLGSLERAATMDEAVALAAAAAQEGDVVLLSPACSSFDMFRGFEHRGEVFAAAVRALDEG